MWMTMEEKRKLFFEIESKIDKDKSRLIFKVIISNEEIKDLDIPQINMPKTFRTLITVAYDTHCLDPSGDSDSSGSSLTEWSQVFSGDGRLCFDQLLSSVPRTLKMKSRERDMYGQSLCHAHFAVLYYNENHGAEYELVAPIISDVFLSMKPVPAYIAYVNFFAKPKNSDSSPDLFFAEMVATGYEANEVRECCILPPRLRPVAMTFDFVVFWLPRGKHPDPGSLVDCWA